MITDGGSPEESCRGTFAVASTVAPVALYRCGGDATPAASGVHEPPAAVWRTDSARAVLLDQRIGSGHWLRFASRFHPAWSDLVLSPAFPEWLRGLLRSVAGGDATSELLASDRALTDEARREYGARIRAAAGELRERLDEWLEERS